MACKLTAQQLAELETIYQSGDAQGFADALRLHLNPSWSGKVLELWKANLLTSPSTHAANIIGNTANLALDVLTTGVAGGIDNVLTRMSGKARTVRAGEMGAQVTGMRSVLGDAFRSFLNESMDAVLQRPEPLPGQQAFEAATAKAKSSIGKGVQAVTKAGFPSAASDVVGKFENPIVGRIGGKTGTFVRTPFRLLESADGFFKRLISAGELYRQAHKSANARGLSGSAASQHISDFVREFYKNVENAQGDPAKMDQRTLGAYKAMQQAALRGTFQEANRHDAFGKATGHIQNVLQDLPILQFLLPFTRTPANIARKSFELTPLGAISPLLDLARGEYIQEHPERLARALIGTIAGASLYAMAKQGYLTGSGPTDANERKEKEQTGWQPYSWAIPDENGKNTYVQFGRFEPLASVASLAADLAEAKDEETAQGTLKKLLAATTNAFTSKTFLQGLEKGFTFWSDPWRFGGQFARDMAGSVVPAGVAAIARATDDKMRDTSRGNLAEQIGSTIESRIPGLSQRLPVRHTGLGEEQERQSGPLFRLLSPAQVTKDKEGPLSDLQREMVRVHYVPRPVGGTFKMPPRKPGEQGQKVALEPDEEELLNEGIRKGADMAIRLMRSPGWDRRPDTEAEASDKSISKEHVLKRAFDQARDEARARVRRMVSRRLRSQITVQ